MLNILSGMDAVESKDVDLVGGEEVGTTLTVDGTGSIADSSTGLVEDGTEPDDVDMDAYIARFGNIEAQHEEGNRLLANALNGQHDQARIKALVEYAVHSQRQIEEMYNLLVDMNNIFGK